MTPFRTARPTAAATLAVCAALATLVAAAPAPATPTSRQDRPRTLPAVTPRAETATLYDDEEGGNANADDPAIWRNPADPDHSLVIATAKEGGLRVHDLDARLVQSLPAPAAPGPDHAPGRFNNVDLVHGLRLSPGGTADVAVTSDRGHDRLRIHRIDPSRPGGPLTDVTDPAAPRVFSADQDEVDEQATAYGLATWTDRRSGRSYALANGATAPRSRCWNCSRPGPAPSPTARSGASTCPPRSGCPTARPGRPAASRASCPRSRGWWSTRPTARSTCGQEDVGIWQMPADLRGKPVLVDKVREYGVPGTYDEESEECAPGRTRASAAAGSRPTWRG